MTNRTASSLGIILATFCLAASLSLTALPALAEEAVTDDDAITQSSDQDLEETASDESGQNEPGGGQDAEGDGQDDSPEASDPPIAEGDPADQLDGTDEPGGGDGEETPDDTVEEVVPDIAPEGEAGEVDKAGADKAPGDEIAQPEEPVAADVGEKSDGTQDQPAEALSPADVVALAYAYANPLATDGRLNLVVQTKGIDSPISAATLTLRNGDDEIALAASLILKDSYLLFELPRASTPDAPASIAALKLVHGEDGDVTTVDFGLDELDYTLPVVEESSDGTQPRAWYPQPEEEGASEPLSQMLDGDDIVLDDDVLAVLQMLCPVTETVETAVDAPRQLFADTPASEWYVKEGYLDYVVNQGLMSGYKDGSNTFGPNNTLNRAQVVTILFRYANPGSAATTDPSSYGTVSHFWDVPAGAYYTAAVEWAYSNGITTGYGGTGSFGPSDPITRQDLMTMVYRFAKRCGVGGSTSFVQSFPDKESLYSYAVAPMGWANARGIITGDMSSGTARLAPQDYTTRAQAAKIFTVLMRDVLCGATMQGLSWSFDGVKSSNSYVVVGSNVRLTANVSCATRGLTYKYGWYTSDDSWQSDSTSSTSFDFYLGGSGTFTLWCQVTDADGVSFKKTCSVVVWRSATPYASSNNGTATWTVTPSITAGNASKFTFEYSWYRGKDESSASYVGSKASSSSTSASATFSQQDYYWFKVKATDPEGHSSTASVRVLYAPSGKIGYQNPSYYYQVSSYNVSPYPGASGIFAYMTASRISADATRSECVETFIDRAYEYLGTPYVWDYACAPWVGVDCIGLVFQCAYACGMDLGEFNPYLHYATGPSGWHSHDAMNMWNYGSIWKSTNLSYRQRGDLIFYPGHVAIYLGNNKVIQALPSSGVHISSMWSAGSPLGIGRLFV